MFRCVPIKQTSRANNTTKLFWIVNQIGNRYLNTILSTHALYMLYIYQQCVVRLGRGERERKSENVPYEKIINIREKYN